MSFQKGHSFSSQSRYDHFDTTPCIYLHISPQKHLGKRRELMERTKEYLLFVMTSSIHLHLCLSAKFFQIATFIAHFTNKKHFGKNWRKEQRNIHFSNSLKTLVLREFAADKTAFSPSHFKSSSLWPLQYVSLCVTYIVYKN